MFVAVGVRVWVIVGLGVLVGIIGVLVSDGSVRLEVRVLFLSSESELKLNPTQTRQPINNSRKVMIFHKLALLCFLGVTRGVSAVSEMGSDFIPFPVSAFSIATVFPQYWQNIASSWISLEQCGQLIIIPSLSKKYLVYTYYAWLRLGLQEH